MRTQIVFNKNSIEKLLDKLTTGNSCSIHLNAIPGKGKTRLDLVDFALSFDKSLINSDNVAGDFLNTLLTKEKFKFTISIQDILKDIYRINNSQQYK